jgi:LAGLIDADG DNA endonuclease family
MRINDHWKYVRWFNSRKKETVIVRFDDNLNHQWKMNFIFIIYIHCLKIIVVLTDRRGHQFKEYISIKFQSLSISCFNKYRELFYNPNGNKVIPNHLINLLTMKGLAYSKMDDDDQSKKDFYFSTHFLTLNEYKY